MSQGVTNLRSVDYSKDGTACACQSVNFEDVAMEATNDWDTYQYVVTLTDAEVYTCDVSRSSMKLESQCDEIGGAAATDGIVIGGSLTNINTHNTACNT